MIIVERKKSSEGRKKIMDNKDFEKTIEHNFDSFCKKVLKNEANDYHRHINKYIFIITLEWVSC